MLKLSILLKQICLNHNKINKIIELLLFKKQNANIELNCQNVNSFLSRYFDFNSMWKFIVTDVINEKKLQRFRCVLLKLFSRVKKSTIYRSRKSINNTNKKTKKWIVFRNAIKNTRNRKNCDRVFEIFQIHDEMHNRNELFVNVDANHCWIRKYRCKCDKREKNLNELEW